MSRFICSLIAFLLAFHAAMAMIVPPQHQKIKLTCKTITVDPSAGKGDFGTIQAAVESVPMYGTTWTCIRVNPGIYRERVYFDYGRSFIYLVGEGKERTTIVSDGHDPFDTTATFTTRTDNLIVEGISFNNSYNQPPIGNPNPRKQAAAAKIEGDKLAFYGCGFYGLQDTLWDVSGRHYFKQCSIEGAVDFIFGAGQSIYEKCMITVVGDAIAPTPGYITAQARGVPTETSGFVFKYSTIIGNGQAYLGRPWRSYARVVFYKTYFSSLVVPEGWYAKEDDKATAKFAEAECFGPGADPSGRAEWVKNKVSDAELKELISISYINNDGWIMPEPDNMITN